MLKRLIVIALALFILASAAARAQGQSTLYQRLGEKPGINLLVDWFVHQIKSDSRVYYKFFKHTNWDTFHVSMVHLISTISGGPRDYHGPSMKDVHKGMQITDADFDAVVEDFVKAENRVGIGKWEQQQLAKALLATRPDIVTVKTRK